jgi:hypothetical protein
LVLSGNIVAESGKTKFNTAPAPVTESYMETPIPEPIENATSVSDGLVLIFDSQKLSKSIFYINM